MDSRIQVFVAAFLGFCSVYHIFSPHFTSVKQSAWIITTTAALIMTLASAPFLWDYILSGASIQHVRTFTSWSIPATTFFQAYLFAQVSFDLIIGFMYYRSQLSLLTGWIHHIMYIMIVEFSISRSWSHIFMLCSVMEFPTFFLGLTTLYPRLRSNLFFAISFFLTRISFHIVLCMSYLLPKNRAAITDGSFIPALLLLAILPLHAMWFRGCVRGFIRRAGSEQITLRATIWAKVHRPMPYYRLRHVNDAARRVREYAARRVPGRIYQSLPTREKVFDRLGLGKRRLSQTAI
ncbi:hypothetical protein C8J56DRAFT_782376 [Mycena floridula]|nr:hypothetical protein C8J56DRAFT_782376 [Mycena floridula]